MAAPLMMSTFPHLRTSRLAGPSQGIAVIPRMPALPTPAKVVSSSPQCGVAPGKPGYHHHHEISSRWPTTQTGSRKLSKLAQLKILTFSVLHVDGFRPTDASRISNVTSGLIYAKTTMRTKTAIGAREFAFRIPRDTCFPLMLSHTCLRTKRGLEVACAVSVDGTLSKDILITQISPVYLTCSRNNFR